MALVLEGAVATEAGTTGRNSGQFVHFGDVPPLTPTRRDQIVADIQVIHNEAEHRYEARVDNALAGFAEYQLTDQLVVFTHTEVEPAFEGKGVGGALARIALDDVRSQASRKVLPICPFIKAWIGKHPDYIPLVYGAAPSTATD
ncbi:MAG: GNAT family N-acetyltransferase [Tetrasphaera sp.]